MKKSNMLMLASAFLVSLLPVQIKAASDEPPISNAPSRDEAKARTLISRLHVIHAMDKSGLNSSEKSALRAEVKGIDKNLRDIGGGVYISVGAVIIILLILLILL